MQVASAEDSRKAFPPGFTTAYLMVLTAVAAWIRIRGAGEYYYSPDEAMHIGIASGRDLREVLRFSRYESHPPLLYILCHYWMTISATPAFMRGFSLFFGLATIPLYYRIGKTLNGEVTGLACATLIAFSRGCIILSCVVRHYMLFFFLLSLAFYCYLLWRKRGNISALAGYAVFGCLAATAHFSSVFALFCLSACETIELLRRHAGARQWLLWIGANLPVILTIGILYALWLPMLTLLHAYFNMAGLDWHTRLNVLLLYPLGIPLYLFPGITCAIPLACGFILLGIRQWPAILRSETLAFLCSMAGFAVALGMFLFIANIYTPVGGRHNLWMFPFIVPVLGWLSAEIIAGKPLIATGIFAFFFALYSPANRFADKNEYALLNADHAALEQLFAGLGPTDRIIMERDDAVMFAPVYPVLGDTPYHPVAHAMSIPYHNTQLMFDGFFRRLATPEALSDFFAQARQKHLLDGADRLVFFYSLWPHSIAAKLMLCKALDKQVIVFPPAPAGIPLAPDVIYNARAAVMLVSKQTFLADALSPEGKAHACVENKE